MRKTIIILTMCMIAAIQAKADEGMWLPSLISQRIEDMQAKGFRLDAEDIYSINQASSLKPLACMSSILCEISDGSHIPSSAFA